MYRAKSEIFDFVYYYLTVVVCACVENISRGSRVMDIIYVVVDIMNS